MMSQETPTDTGGLSERVKYFLHGFGILLFIAGLGLFYVKWYPYFQKSFQAAASHSLGPSIVSGEEAAPPTASFSAATDYSITYFKAIWKALVLALLLATTVEVLVPRNWPARVLGRASFRSWALGGLFALPGMM